MTVFHPDQPEWFDRDYKGLLLSWSIHILGWILSISGGMLISASAWDYYTIADKGKYYGGMAVAVVGTMCWWIGLILVIIRLVRGRRLRKRKVLNNPYGGVGVGIDVRAEMGRVDMITDNGLPGYSMVSTTGNPYAACPPPPPAITSHALGNGEVQGGYVFGYGDSGMNVPMGRGDGDVPMVTPYNAAPHNGGGEGQTKIGAVQMCEWR